MIRHPWTSAYLDFLHAYSGVYSEGMMSELYRRYPKIGRQLDALHKAGKISTVDPAHLTAEDIKEYVRTERQRGLKPASISHDISAISNLCDYCSNSAAVKEARARYPLLFPKREHRRLPVVERPAFEVVRDAADKLTSEDDPRLIRAFAAVMLAFGIGPRIEELQHALRRNIAPDFSSVRLEFVKGMGTYGQSRVVPIRPDCLHAIKLWISISSGDCIICSLKGEMLSPMQLTRDRLRVCKLTGVTFDYRATRRTYAQYILDEGLLSVEELSIILGHATSKTTETSYARPRNDRVVAKLIDSWSD